MEERAATLVLAGGGARGAFQVGAERVLREEFGFRWERIFGVSVGGLNGTLLGQQEYGELMTLWQSLQERDIYKKIPWPLVAFRIGVQQKLGFYDNSPLRALIQKYAAGRPFRVPVHVGRVSLVSGDFEMVTQDSPGFLDAVWQGATLPVLWEAIGPRAYVDGGLRNVTPLGDALSFNPTRIVVILCSSLGPDEVRAPANVLDVAKRSLTDITINEILRNDVEDFVRINELVKQAYDGGVTLRKPDGTPYVYCPITVLEPVKPMGDSLDFSQESIRLRIRYGEELAREVMAQQAAVNVPPPVPSMPAH
jgi:NTE family protein